MYTAIIEAYDLNRIDTEARIIATPTRETLSETIEFADIFVAQNDIMLHEGYGITVNYVYKGE